jgi:predicted nucleotidyltransferase
MNQLIPLLTQLAHDCGAEKLILFGSRARRDHRERSDIDLAVFGMPEEQQTRFWCGIEELPTLLKFDLVFVDAYTSPDLRKEIDRDGVILYENQTR